MKSIIEDPMFLPDEMQTIWDAIIIVIELVENPRTSCYYEGISRADLIHVRDKMLSIKFDYERRIKQLNDL